MLLDSVHRLPNIVSASLRAEAAKIKKIDSEIMSLRDEIKSNKKHKLNAHSIKETCISLTNKKINLLQQLEDSFDSYLLSIKEQETPLLKQIANRKRLEKKLKAKLKARRKKERLKVDEGVYCYCGRGGEGPMVECDGPKVLIMMTLVCEKVVSLRLCGINCCSFERG
eukprot:TRINITY_DN5140_c0_g2_i9.p1 TRINITY_DN5140_c0_g2~~TRINITY_DN5140_c0_g2_i9.p1  ORF type:complete len:168 (+),score=23.11 TRINITY_DN5140_c0_g2_i9:98-601(+)